ncbi:hypothetical protein [Agromyces sp. NPDC058064]|uniref:hypothetical protein n=1 Tax=Agromyces sp. NPDC058064 TaxID=3346322 RepID=UPI0036DCCBBA
MNTNKITPTVEKVISALPDLDTLADELMRQAVKLEETATELAELATNGAEFDIIPNGYANASGETRYYISEHFKGDRFDHVSLLGVEQWASIHPTVPPEGHEWRDELDGDLHRIRRGVWELVATVNMGSPEETYPEPYRYAVLERVAE